MCVFFYRIFPNLNVRSGPIDSVQKIDAKKYSGGVVAVSNHELNPEGLVIEGKF